MNTNNPFEATVPNLERVTDKYRFIPTSTVVEDLRSLGYQPVARWYPKRGRGLSLHAIDFRHALLSRPELEGIAFQLRLYNAHDGTAAFRFALTLLNGVCLNILEPAESAEFVNLSTRIVHRGYALEHLKSALDGIEVATDALVARVTRLQEVMVSESVQNAFCFKASELRDAKAYLPSKLARVLHVPQAVPTAWNVFNRVQESLIRGGYLTEGLDGHLRSARALTSVRDTAMVNRKLWALAESVLLKG